MKRNNFNLGCLCAGLLFATACATGTEKAKDHTHTATVEQAKDDSFISVSGTVIQATPDGFKLDYGEGSIWVEMDDFDAYKEGYGILLNDDVIVTGYVDADFYENKKIEADSVYVDDIMTSFQASSTDDEDFDRFAIVDAVAIPKVFEETKLAAEWIIQVES